MTKMHMVNAINNAIDLAMQKNENIVVLGEDVGVDGGVFRVTDGLIQKYGEERVIDTPIAESGIVGCSIGMATAGLRPIAEMQFSGFSYQAFAQIKQHAARWRQRTKGTTSCPIIIRMPMSGGIRALEHHSESPETFYIHCQGLKVVMPSTPKKAKGLLLASLEQNDPVIFLEPKKIYRSFKEEVDDAEFTIELEKCDIVKEGKQLTIITWGAMVHETIKAVEESQTDAEIIDLQTLWPLDEDTIIQSVQKTGKAMIVHEATRTAGFGAEIGFRIQQKCLYNLEAPVMRVTGPDVPFPQFAQENYFLPNKEKIKNAIKEIMQN